MTALEVVRTGPSALVEDLGRPGHADRGISPSGVLDRASSAALNRLLGNRRDAAVIEIVLGGAAFRAHGELIVAIAGAAGPVSVDSGAAAWGAPVVLRNGQTIQVGAATFGIRYLLGVRGGIEAVRTLGSASTDQRSGIGPAALRSGDLLPVGEPVAPLAAHPLVPTIPAAGAVTLHVILGPRDTAFTPAATRRLIDADWTVSADSDRVGLRLDGPPLERTSIAELPSEGMVTGGIQVAPAGPIVFLADHPTTGGYPVIAVVDRSDLDIAGQLRPGQLVRFVVGRAEARIRTLSPRLPPY